MDRTEPLSRRGFLGRLGAGAAGLACSYLLPRAADASAADEVRARYAGSGPLLDELERTGELGRLAIDELPDPLGARTALQRGRFAVYADERDGERLLCAVRLDEPGVAAYARVPDAVRVDEFAGGDVFQKDEAAWFSRLARVARAHHDYVNRRTA